MLITPPFLKTKTTLKTLCYEYNGFEGLSFDNIASTSILGLELPTDGIYQTMLFSVCDNYWYDEIGFDIDEIFIERFKNTWSRYSSQYHSAIEAYLNNNIFNIVEQRAVGQTDTGTTTSTKSGTDTTKNTGTVTDTNTGTINKSNTGTVATEGSRQDYQVQTQDTDSTTTNNLAEKQTNDLSSTRTDNLSNATTYGSAVSNEQNLQKKINTTRTLTDYSPERLREIIESVGLINSFVDCFHKLFMQIIVR